MELLLLASICLIAILYSSVGHGGASGYLAVLSLTIYATQDPIWLKQHVWSLNLIVASIAFFTYKSSGFFSWKLTIPFIVASINPEITVRRAAHLNQNRADGAITLPIAGFCSSGIFAILGI